MEKKFIQSCTNLQKLFILASLMKLEPVKIEHGFVIVTYNKAPTVFDPFTDEEWFEEVYSKFAGKVTYWSNLPNFKQMFIDSVLYYHACPVKLSELSNIR